MNIGKIKLDQPLALAPMQDITDMPFRFICKQLGADLVYTEFTSSEALIRDIEKAKQKIRIMEEERPVGIQIFGSVEESMRQATRMVEALKPDFIDINCGCWTKRHALRGEGAGLLKDLKSFERIVKTTVRSTKLPVTVKTRLGWDHKDIVILELAKIAEQAGAQALTVHCRTRVQGYKGKADWTWLAQIKKATSITLIGNGDIITPQDVKKMFACGCDGVMIGRGAWNNPWIFKQSKHFLKTNTLLAAATLKERVELCLSHLKLSVQYRGLPDGVIRFRKYYTGYFHGFPHAAKLRAELMGLLDFKDVQERLYQFLEREKDTPLEVLEAKTYA